MTTNICRVLGAIGFGFCVACVPTPTTPLIVPSPPTVTVLAQGIASSAAIVVDNQQVLVGETQLGARPGDSRSGVRSIPVRGGQSVPLPETQGPGVITALAAASDGTLFVSRRAAPDLAMSTIAAYRTGHESILIRAVASPPDTVSLRSPAGIAVATSGDLIVADIVGSQILRISAAGQVERVAGTGSCPSGPLSTPLAGAALATAICGPELLARDDQGNIYVARRGSRWIAKIDQSGTLSVLIATNEVTGLATDALGALLVSDAARGEILRFQGGRSSAVVTGLEMPTSLAVGPDGAIFVLADKSRELLRIVIN